MKLFGNKRSGSHANRVPDNIEPIESIDSMDEFNNDALDSFELDGFQSGSISDDIMLEASSTVFSMEGDEMPDEEQSESDTTQENQGKKKRLTGLQKGLIILAAAIIGTVLMVVIMWNAFAKAPDFSDSLPPGQSTDVVDPNSEQQAISATAKVTTTTIVTKDQTTGEEIEMTIEVPVGRKEGYYTILLVGTDTSDALTDTIMVASYDTVNNKLNIVSVPRDTLTDGRWEGGKINSAYMAAGQGEDGIEFLKSKLTDILGIPIDCYAMIDLTAFVDIIDIIGGVWFDVPQRMYYSDPTQNLLINLNAGEQLLNGNMAMQLVRFRSYGSGRADLARVEVQQDFMIACAKQLLQIGNTAKIRELAKTLSENLMTNLSLGNIAWFGTLLLKTDIEDITTCTLPGYASSYGGLSCLALYGADVLDMVNEYLNPYEIDLTIDDINPLTVSGGVRVKSTRSASGGSVGNSVSGSSSGSSSSSTGTAAQASPAASSAPVTEPEPEASEEPIEAAEPGGEADGELSGETGLEPAQSGAGEEPAESIVPDNVVETRQEELPGGSDDSIAPAGGNIAG